MPIYWEQSGGGLQEEEFDMEVEDEGCVTQKPQMRGNDEEEQMEDLEVKTILTLKLKMKDKLLNDNYRSEELVLHNEMDYEVHSEESVIQKSKVDSLVVLANSIDVSTQSINLFIDSTNVSTQLVIEVQGERSRVNIVDLGRL